MTKVRHQSNERITKKTTNVRGSLRLKLLSGAGMVLPALLVPAHGQEITITDARTTPIFTSTIDGGNPADIIIDAGGSVTVTDGTAVTVDSSNNLTHNGTITVEASDNSIGVLLQPGNSGDYTQTGDIVMDQSQAQSDADDASDDPVDYNDNRVGILLDQGGTFTGDINLTSDASISMFGDMSAGIRMLGDLDGSVQIDGDFSISGMNNQAVAISGNVTGDVIFGATSNTFVNGAGSVGVLVDGSIDGAFVFGGTMQVTGYTDLIPDADDDEDNDNAAQIGRQGGAGIQINGTVNGGVLIDGPLPADQLPEVAEGEDPIVNPSPAQITTFSSSPAVLIADSSLGLVDTSGQADPAAYGSFGFINRGVLQSQGLYDVDTNTVIVDNSTIAGGIRNDGSINATGRNGNSVGLTIRNGANVPSIFNNSIIDVNTTGSLGDMAMGSPFETIGILIEDAATTVNEITNALIINAVAVSDDGSAIAVRDESGSVTQLTNMGTVAARILEDPTNNEAGADPDVPTGQAIAFDFSANTTGVTITNTVTDDFDASTDNRNSFGIVLGDVLFGAGNDAYIADAGTTTGDISFAAGDDMLALSQGASISGDIDFGSGNDSLTLSNGTIAGNLSFGSGMDSLNFTDGSTFVGEVSDTDDNLSISLATDSSLNFSNISSLGLSSLFVDATSSLGIAIQDQTLITDPGDLRATRLNVSGTALFEAGATINPIFLGAVPDGTFSTTIISSNLLNADPDSIVIGDNDGNTPFLFEFDLEAVNNDLILNVNRKTADQLGIATELEPAIDPTIAALNRDLQLGVLLFNLTTQEDFENAFGQLIAAPLDAPLTYARAQTNSVTSIITQRLDMARNSGSYGRTFWLQEEGYFVNRDEDEASNGFDGGGFAIALGVDAGFEDIIDAIGLSASFSSARYDEQAGEDFPFNRVTYGLGAYGAASFGNVKVDARAEYAISQSDSERNVVLGTVRRKAIGEWDGSQIAASGRVSYEGKINDYSLEPFVSVDILSITEDAYSETGGGDGVNLSVAEREADSIRTNFGLKAGKEFKIQPSAFDTGIPGTIHPQFTVAWSQELNDDPMEATYTYVSGGESFTLLSDPEDGAAIVGADIAYENEYAKVHIGTSGTFGDTTQAYVLRAGVGLKW